MFATVALVSGLVATAAPPSPTGHPSGLVQRAYVWQRAWTPALRRALAESGPAFAALDVLAAEVTWQDSVPSTHRIQPDWPALQATQRAVGVVVRVGPCSGRWADGSAEVRAVIEACRASLADARSRGVEPAELQLDFDAPTARLAEYRSLLHAVRREVAPPRLVITALPDWLRSPAFTALGELTDCFVLQVHSLEKPDDIRQPYTLCDPVRALRWIAQAEKLRRPYRIALPAYGYRLAFDAAGKFAGLTAEGPALTWPAGYRERLVLADATALAALVKLLVAAPPTACEGIAWFRLPTDEDELAWSWPTLRAVMGGTPPEARLALRAEPTSDRSFDLSEINQGTAGAEPAPFLVQWHDARLVAADAIAGWQYERRGSGALVIRPPKFGTNGILRPGGAIAVGWLRFDGPATLTLAPAQ